MNVIFFLIRLYVCSAGPASQEAAGSSGLFSIVVLVVVAVALV